MKRSPRSQFVDRARLVKMRLRFSCERIKLLKLLSITQPTKCVSNESILVRIASPVRSPVSD